MLGLVEVELFQQQVAAAEVEAHRKMAVDVAGVVAASATAVAALDTQFAEAFVVAAAAIAVVGEEHETVAAAMLLVAAFDGLLLVVYGQPLLARLVDALHALVAAVARQPVAFSKPPVAEQQLLLASF